MTRAGILDRAKEIVCNDRNMQYGEPEDNFGAIANLWVAYLQGRSVRIDFLDPYDVAAMMILFKVGRAATAKEKPTLDTFIDIAGYAACGAECVDKPVEEA